ncbi:hypothetical protein ND925_08480 [Vibrio diabolicus]|uniref:hypothetical protein n=1 Tax=Vibrio diabolicus TaxID=50719 RepID=UPI002160DE00|nr:hypothetical protein [Vibrio diabolicus]MCS0382813.1 hypothetical protein [Vibrio diabolicus]
MITLPVSLSLEKIEAVIDEIYRVDQAELELPVQTKHIAFGGYAAAIQAVNTWARKHSERSLLVKESKSGIEDSIENVIKYPHKFTAAMMAKNITLTDAESLDIRKNIYSYAKESIIRQSEHLYGQNHGRLCWYSFVDHSTKGFDRNYYSLPKFGKVQTRGLNQITNVIKAMVEKSSLVAGGGILLSEDEVSSLGRLFYELFLNTDEHGRQGYGNKLLKPGSRVIYTYGINLTDEGVTNSVKNDLALQKYIENLSLLDISANKFIELSVVDSGLGYCNRWLATDTSDIDEKELNITQEYDILTKCFKFRETSTNSMVKGNGLPSVMSNLRALRAFIRIRSNRLCVYKDFAKRDDMELSQSNYNFYDWDSMLPCEDKLTVKNNVSGVSVTILIPLEMKNSRFGESK